MHPAATTSSTQQALDAAAAAAGLTVPGPPAGGAEPADSSPQARAWAVLQAVPDPEVPVLSVCDLGIVRAVNLLAEGGIEVVLTPTYSGCPATEVIEHSCLAALRAAGFAEVRARTQRAPAWTTDWISPEGRRKLKAYGIAPPGACAAAVPNAASEQTLHFLPRPAAPVPCPRCDSLNTERLSAFGATACKALYRCIACREPFEHFKPI